MERVHDAVAFFTRILDFKRAFLAKLRDKRAHPRYPVGAAFPLKASLLLAGHDRPGKKDSASGLSWSGPLGNISSNGLSVFLAPAAQTTRGEETFVRLTLGTQTIEIPCTVAHFRVYGSYSICGVKLNFSDFKIQKAYHQIVEAVSVGASFEPAESKPRATASQVSQQWRSVNRSSLSEWRNATTRKVERFELVVGEHRLIGHSTPPTLEVTARGTNVKTPVAAAVAAEVRTFFHWVTTNLPKNVPADLRDFMGRLTQAGVARDGWAPPPSKK